MAGRGRLCASVSLWLILFFLLCPTAARAQSPADPKINDQVLTLHKQAIGHIDRQDWGAAERSLLASLKLQPHNAVTLYNLACVNARQSEPEQSITYLERAAAAGFTDFTLIGRDPDLDPLRELPRFQALIAKKDDYQRKAAGRIAAGLRQRFGPKYVYEVDHDRKLIYAAGVDAGAFQQVKAHLQRQAEAQAADLFEHAPEAFVTVVIPAPADFRKLIRLKGVGGMYIDATKTLIAQRVGAELSHEFTHALHAADRAALGHAEHSMWLSEGLGVLYEGIASDEHGKLVPADNQRMAAIRAAARRRGLIPLRRLLAMSRDEYMKRPMVTYGQSGALLLYLYDRRQLRAFYEAYKKTYAEEPTGRAALEQVMKMPLDELEAHWMKWLTAVE